MADPSGKLKPTRVVSRPLVAAWCLWLLASWALNLGMDAPGWWSADTFLPAVRGMIQSAMLGLGLAWPAWRLSQGRPRLAGPETTADLLCLLLVLQIVLWPMRLLVDWPLRQTLLIDAAFVVWALPVGLLVWLGRRGGRATVRAAAMAGCALILFGGWGLAGWTGEARFAAWSPMHMLWWVVGEPDGFDAGAVTARLVVVLLAVMAVWAVVLIRAARPHPRRPSDREQSGLPREPR